MLLRVTPAMQEYLRDAISDALGRAVSQPSDAVYLKVHEAMQGAKRGGQTVTIVASLADLRELADRANYEVGPGGVCDENLGWSSAPADKTYWMARKRAYKALLAQIDAHRPPAAAARSN